CAHPREAGREAILIIVAGMPTFAKRSPTVLCPDGDLVLRRMLESPAMANSRAALLRAKKVRLLLFDVDGVLTDGKLFIFTAPPGAQQTIFEQAGKHGRQGGFGLHSQTLLEAKGFHAHDGTAISLARLAGIKTGLITKRISETVALRARDLKLEHVYQ